MPGVASDETIAREVPHLRRHAPRVATIVVALAWALALPASGAGQTPSCGDVVTQSVRLTASLTGCTAGLVVGADSITIDLNGHAIEGVAGAGIGIDAVGKSGVTVRNGRVRGFDVGVRLLNTSGSVVRGISIRNASRGISLATTSGAPPAIPNELVGNRVTDSGTGIFTFGSWDRVVGNVLLGLSGSGILCRDGGGSEISFNFAARSNTGFELLFCTADLTANVASDNLADGIARIRALGLVRANTASGNGGHGIYSEDAHGVFSSNIMAANGGNGLTIVDEFAGHGPLHTITGNVAIANRGHGIFTLLEGVIDGGNNRARGNGTTPQCVGVVCR